MATIYALTPHPINIFNEDDCVYNYVKKWLELKTLAVPARIIFPLPGAPVPRCTKARCAADSIDGVPTCHVTYDMVTNLPDPQPDVYLVVSARTADVIKKVAKDRTDLLIPENIVKDATGRPIGCTMLSRV